MAGIHGSRTDENHAIRAQAEEWFVRVRAGGMTVEEMTAWHRWLEQSESHERAFRDVENLWEEIGQIQHLSWPTADELNTDRYEGQMPLAEWISAQAGHPALDRENTRKDGDRDSRRRVWLWSGALAASVAVMVAAGLWLNREFFGSAASPGPLSVTTDVGQHHELTLPDGSTVTVGARSQISVQFSDRTRGFRLDGGEAYFAVAHEDARPFVVRAGDGSITAMGTEFNVQQIARRVVVTVVEGSVQVAGIPATPVTRVQAGEQLVYGEAPSPVRTVDPAAAVTWREGHLKYLGQPLKYVIPDVQRYSRKRLVIADEAVGQLGFTGTVFQDDVEEWLEGLETSLPIEVVATDDYTVVLKARTD